MQPRMLTFVAGILATLAPDVGRPSGPISPAMTVVRWNSRQVEQAKAVLSHLTQWPSSKELTTLVADADSEAARRCAVEWLRLVLRGDWIPSDIAGRLQAVPRSPAGHDLLVAQYAAADCSFRIWDTSVALTVEISSPSLRNDVTDWPAFLKSVMARFLNGAGHREEKTGLDEFARCTVHRGGDVARLLVSYAVPAVKENNSQRYWEEGNPTFWKQGGRLIITLTKLPDGEHPLHEEYGLKQRFPPVESRLASATLEQLIEPLLAVDPQDPNTMAWGRLAERAIMKRPDKFGVVLPLLRSLGRAKGEYGQLMAVNTIDVVLRDCRDRRLLETARESLLALRPAPKDPKVQGQIANTVKRIEDLLQSANAERGPGVKSGPGPRESPFDEKADTLSAALLPTVSYLATWPGKDVLAGPGRVPVEEYKDAASHSIYWLEKVVNATVRPITNKTFRQSLILLKGGTGAPDVVRAQWTKDGYRFQVSQSLAVMTIRVVPPAGADLGQTVEAKRRYAASLAGRIFAATDTRAGPNTTRVAVKGLAKKIVAYSFRPAKTRALKDAVIGAPVTKEDEGVMPPHSGAEIDAENRADNRQWDRSSSSWGYWWRHVSWWNDRKSVGFVILKDEAGPIRVDYASPALNQWFAPRKAGPATPGAN